MAGVDRRNAREEPLQVRLKSAVEKRQQSYLWVPGDTPPFVPALSPTVYGDGRALFTLSTINQRPRYWIIRCDSEWDSDDFCQMTDDILADLEEHFGNGLCGYSGTSLFWPKKDRIRNCRCEDCTDGEYRAKWPMVDGSGGCSWSRMDWPKGFLTAPNPLCWRGNLLKTEQEH